MNNVPYTYYLEWASGMKYYGVRYAKNCKPEDLWVKYKTSSKYVKDYVKQFGEPIKTEVRKTFYGTNRIEMSISWEKRVLDKLDAAHRDDYLNKRNSKCINCMDLIIKENRRLTDLMPETKEKRSISALKREADPIKRNNRLSKAFSKDAIDKRKLSVAITNQLPETKEKRSKSSIEINSRPEILLANKTRLLGVTWEERIGDEAASLFKKKMSELKKEWHKNHPYTGERTGLNSPCADLTIYTWCNKSTNQIVKLTRVEFCEQYGIDNKNLQRIIKNKEKRTVHGRPYSIQGWILIN